MIDTPIRTEMPPIIVTLEPIIQMTDEEFYELCQLNPELRLERTAKGDVIIMPPAGGTTGHYNAYLTATFFAWAGRNGEGVIFDSSTGFNLPKGGTRSPDVAWVRRKQLASLTLEEKQGFLPLCPEFVLELRSSSDRVADLQKKMEEYVANGAQLGWLLVPETSSVYVYRPGRPPQHLQGITTISGDPELPGFVLDLTPIWQPL
jgi:Uma2 family endonuclease